MSWRFKNPYSTISKLIARDGINCCWCGEPCNPSARSDCDDKYPTIEHLLPRSKGGKTIMSNLKVACRKCNNARGAPDWDGVVVKTVFEKKKKRKDYLAEKLTLGDAWDKLISS